MPHYTLAHCQPNESCTIQALHGDLEMKLRLVNLGFHTHSLVKVLMKRDGAWIVNVDGSRFAIDQEIAKHIEVEMGA
jgi:ferrous iron transport protein A